MRDTCFLLGAGASVEAGLPAMARLRSDFLTAYEEQVLSGCLHEFIESWCEHQHIAYTDGFNQHVMWEHHLLGSDQIPLRIWKLHGSTSRACAGPTRSE